VLRLAASVERASEHPLAAAIVAAAAERRIELAAVLGFDSPTGKGVVGMVERRRIALGNAKFLAELGIATGSLDGEAERLRGDGATAIYLAVDGKLAGVIAIADPVKPTTSDALAALRADGIEIVMLTGDNRTTALAVARMLGIDDVEAEVLPEQKSAVVEARRRAGRVVAMAGDGVNDAPALAAADVGIAMGVAGTDAALETADVALMADELMKIPYALRLSRATVRNIRANIAFSIGLKTAFMVMAVLGMATLWMAVVADMGASLIVIANALRLLRE
jgi:P-type Cu+ transporter